MTSAFRVVLGPDSGALGSALSLAMVRPETLARIERFPDGESRVSIDPPVRGQRVALLKALGAPVGDGLLELALLADAAHRGGARELVGLVPYLGYARQDRRGHEAEALGAAVVARLLGTCGFERILCVDLHAPALEGFSSAPLDNLTAERLLADALKPLARNGVVVAPDLGAAKLARRYALELELPFAIVHKTRLSAHEVTVSHIVGDVKGRRPLIVDDMISTGNTVAASFDAVVAAGALPNAIVAATHGVLTKGADELLASRHIERVFVTDSIEPLARPQSLRLERVSLAPLLLDVLERLEMNRSLEGLLAKT